VTAGLMGWSLSVQDSSSVSAADLNALTVGTACAAAVLGFQLLLFAAEKVPTTASPAGSRSDKASAVQSKLLQCIFVNQDVGWNFSSYPLGGGAGQRMTHLQSAGDQYQWMAHRLAL